MAAAIVYGLCAMQGFLVPHAPVAPTAKPRAATVRMDIDMGTVVGVGVALAGVGGGIGLIAFTENAGKRNEALESAQPCVVCKGKKVIECSICKGTGVDQYASLVAGVKDISGDTPPPPPGTAVKVLVDDWDEGVKEVEMYADILKDYPVKATENVCINCDGRGVIVCDNCQGSGLQPRFLERYSPDDFMD